MNLIRKMFASAEESGGLMSDAETDQPQAAAATPAIVRRLRMGRASHVGRVRSQNEDALLTIESQFDGDEPLASFGIYVVADGMGGHLAGEVASSLAARVVASQLMRDVYTPYILQTVPTSDQVPLTTALETAVEAANQAVHSQVPGSGTTLTCALIIDARAYLAHVGDSRAYLYYNQQLKQVTKDHSYVDKLVELGQITVEAAAVHPQRNVLYRAVGQGEQLEIDLHLIDLPVGARLLLCCDGLWGMLPDPIIQAILASAETPQDACTELIAAANEAGGRDNITAIIIERSEH
jgi:serine/threonine protein phosphatase PrpC